MTQTSPAVVPPPLWIQLTPPRASFAPFSGRVLEFDVNGLPLNTRFPAGARDLAQVLRGAEWRATVAIGTDGLEQRLDEFLARKERAGRTYGMRFRDENEHSLRIDLQADG